MWDIDDIKEIPTRIRDKWSSIGHNNEKGLDDFASNSDVTIVDKANEGPSDKKLADSSAKPPKEKKKGFTVKSSKPDPEVGSEPIVKLFYEGKGSRDGFINWVEHPPRQMSKRTAWRYDRVAIKVYKIKDFERAPVSGYFALKYHQLDIQNQHLVNALKPIVKKEDVFLSTGGYATFHAPFAPLYFRYDEIQQAHRDTAEGTPLKTQLLLLIRLLGDVFSEAKTEIKRLQEGKLINFKYSWAFFPKDCVVYQPGSDCERVFKVVGTRYQSKPPAVVIEAKEIVFNGTNYSWDKVEFRMPCWEGNMKITDLPLYPLSYHKDPEPIIKRMADRGTRALNYQGLHYREYTGVAYHEAMPGKYEKHNVENRILVDVYGYYKHQDTLNRQGGLATDPKYGAILSSVDPEDKEEDEDVDEDANKPYVAPHQQNTTAFGGQDLSVGGKKTIGQEGAGSHQAASSYIKRLTPQEIEKNKQIMLGRPSDIMFISPFVLGYSLRSKVWLRFYVDDCRPIEWNDDAYEHLVYPEEQKDLVLTFVQNHKKTRDASGEAVDVIKGKGQGLVFLLSGPPGTGKTLTAEAVADRSRRPLLCLQAEDLGINAAVLGANLKKFMEMATEWNAVILLDEADVFLGERNPVDIARNELVSIFLREIEYYRGILFLTTNLFNTIDTAFRSRVNIHLVFRSLAPESRKVVWQKFISRLPPALAVDLVDVKGKAVEGEEGEKQLVKPSDLISDEDFGELSQWDLNGREIKNAVKTVRAWCECKGYAMTLGRLESGIRVTAPNATKRAGAGDTSLYDEE